MTANSHKLTLAVGYLVVTAAVIQAWRNPAAAYELSIYAETPILFWVGISLGLVVAVVTALFAPRKSLCVLGLVLGNVSMIAAVALPSIRGYAYLGMGDAISYLGMAQDIRAGTAAAIDPIYPAIMLVSIFLSEILAIGINESLLLITAVFALVFVTTVPVVVRYVHNSRDLVVISSLSALLLLPINQVTQAGVFLQPYPTTAALFFLPTLLFVFVLFTERRSSRHFFLLVLCCVALLFFHPQQAANLLLFFVALTAFHAIESFKTVERRVDTTLFTPTAAFAVVFWLWIALRYQFEQSIAGLLLSIVRDPETTGDVENVGVSLGELGGSLVELFAKLFLVSLIFCLLTGLIALCVFARHSGRWSLPSLEFVPIQHRTLLHLSVGSIPVGVLFLAYMVFSSQFFRHLGFLMVVATILGSFGLLLVYRVVGRRVDGPTPRIALAVVMIGFLFLTLPVVHYSPYMYQPTNHVTEGKLNGFETTFTHADPQIEYVSIGMTPDRAGDYALGYPSGIDSSPAQGPLADRNLSGEYDTDRYLTVTAVGRETHVSLFDELRLSRSDFEYLETDPHVDNVYSTDDYDLYYVHAVEDESS